MSEFQITKATRAGIIPLIFVWGGTGGGKSRSALEIARGMAGKSGRVIVGDTENGRAKLCTDVIDGGFEHIDFQPPFTPERYCDMLTVLETNATVGVIDSASHLWSGPDGILEEHERVLDKMVGDDWQKREAASWRAWKEPKARLNVFKDRILRCKIPLICCFRGEEKSQLVKDERGKSAIVTSKTTIPIFDKKMLFEALIAFEVYQDDTGQGGLIRFPYPYAKVSHEDVRDILPKPESERINSKHGAAIMKWCTAVSAPTPAPTATPKSPLERLKLSKLWSITESIHGGDVVKLQKWLVDNDVIKGREDLLELPTDRLVAIKATVETKLAGQPAAK